MSRVTLKANESKILVEAAANGGRVVFPTRLKAITQQRMAGLFDQNGLTEAVDGSLHLPRAGYRIIGLRPPRTRTAASSTSETRVSTGDVVRRLLRRQEGATLSELIDATGWLPHTTRAALSRLRSAGTHSPSRSAMMVSPATGCCRLRPWRRSVLAASRGAKRRPRSRREDQP